MPIMVSGADSFLATDPEVLVSAGRGVTHVAGDADELTSTYITTLRSLADDVGHPTVIAAVEHAVSAGHRSAHGYRNAVTNLGRADTNAGVVVSEGDHAAGRKVGSSVLRRPIQDDPHHH